MNEANYIVSMHYMLLSSGVGRVTCVFVVIVIVVIVLLFMYQPKRRKMHNGGDDGKVKMMIIIMIFMLRETLTILLKLPAKTCIVF